MSSPRRGQDQDVAFSGNDIRFGNFIRDYELELLFRKDTASFQVCSFQLMYNRNGYLHWSVVFITRVIFVLNKAETAKYPFL